MSSDSTTCPQGPLVGYRVLELCSTIAGPACARLLADFGADVIKVEPPDGDPVRQMGAIDGDVELYASSLLRNKRTVSIDLKHDRGPELVRRLAARCDIVVENFRPGTLERLGIGYDRMSADNPGLVLVRISGYGQSGPNSAMPGYGAVCEAFGGLRHLTGDPDRPPARVAVALTDYMTSVYAAFGAMMALLERQRTGRGQIVDAALYEAAFSTLEAAVPLHHRKGAIPVRQGSRLPSMAPNNLYLARDGSYVLIAANNNATFGRLASAIARPELAEDKRFHSVRARAENANAIDAIVAEWVAQQDGAEAEKRVQEAGVPASLVYTIKDIFADPHYAAREMLLHVPHDQFGTLAVTGVVPKLSATPGAVYRLGRNIGADTRGVLQRELGLSTADVDDLERTGAIKSAHVGSASASVKSS